ncbi:MAG: PAS domain-containing protein [Candidatus Omnitrophica bacterium]|nr:PAS domain-containing protein [Candidatus Omnitrophota bacterium]
MKIRTKISMAMVLLPLASTLIIGVIIYNFLVDSHLKQTRELLDLSAHRIAKTASNFLKSRKAEIGIMANSKALISLLEDNMNADIAGVEDMIRIVADNYCDLYILDKNGEMRINFKEGIFTENVSKKDYSKLLIKVKEINDVVDCGTEKCADGYLDKIFAQKINDSEGNFFGALCAHISHKKFLEIIGDSTIETKRQGFIISIKDNSVIGEGKKRKAIQEALDSFNIREDKTNFPGQLLMQGLSAAINQKNDLISMVFVPDEGFLVLMDFPFTEYREALDKTKSMAFIVVLAVVLAGSLISMLISYNVSKPIRVLIDKAKATAAGDFSKIITINTYDEFHVLAEAFNQMSGDLELIINDFNQEINRRLIVEENLKEEKLFIEKAIDSLKHPFYIVDKQYQIILANKAAREKGIYTGGKCYQCVHKRESPCDDSGSCLLKEVIMTRKSAAIFNHLHKDEKGTIRMVEVYGDPIFDKDGEVVRMIEYVIDVTEKINAQKNESEANIQLKAAQHELIQAEKMKIIGDLASGVAHEVKNPLAVMLQGTEFLKKKINTEDKSIVLTFNLMLEAIQKADAIVKGLLDFSTASKLEMDKTDINKVIKNAVLLAKHALDKAKIVLVEHIEEGLPELLIDRNKIEQVVVNLILNAVHAMPGSGVLTINAYSKILKAPGQGVGRRGSDLFKLGEKILRIEIIDTGTGISEENIKKMGEPFFTTRRGKGGTGLGLSVVKKIIELHSGKIEFANRDKKEGTGVIVTIWLRMA